MPTIQSISTFSRVQPNSHVSPFGNDAMVQLYSSIPLQEGKDEACLPCVLCGTVDKRIRALTIEAQRFGFPEKDNVTIS